MSVVTADPEPVVWYCHGRGEVGNTPCPAGHGRLPDDAPCRVCALDGRLPPLVANSVNLVPKPCADCGGHKRCRGCGGH